MDGTTCVASANDFCDTTMTSPSGVWNVKHLNANRHWIEYVFTSDYVIVEVDITLKHAPESRWSQYRFTYGSNSDVVGIVLCYMLAAMPDF